MVNHCKSTDLCPLGLPPIDQDSGTASGIQDSPTESGMVLPGELGFSISPPAEDKSELLRHSDFWHTTGGEEPLVAVENPEGDDRDLTNTPLNNVTVLEEGSSAMDFLKEKAYESFGLGEQNAFYVADLGDVVDKYNRFLRELPRVKPFYAVKCNDSKEVLQLLAILGSGFDCASKAEMDLVLSLGVPADDIVYGNTCKQPSFVRHAAKCGITKMTYDCESELFKMAEEYPEAELILRIVANDSGSSNVPSKKFGAPLQKCEALLKLANILNLSVIGVSFHVGTLSRRPQTFSQAIADARHVFDLGRELGHAMRLLDIGGGFPGDYFTPVFEEFATINDALDRYFPDAEGVKIISEPGRYFVTSAFTAALNVIGKKEEFVADGKLDRKLSYYLNDGLFGTFWPFEPRPTKLKLLKDFHHSQKLFPSRLWGPCCVDQDLILEEVSLPDLEIGDWIIFLNMGAYSISKPSTFNGFLPPTVYYTMSQKQFERIRKMQSLAKE
ncbi:ornithine decarboxylase 1-like [Leptodactylus fuscus]|uniref:ornithine decarboxylase 1-like n=1 Tax=Leptodactylus fuscus TaxID=238119 RepID=UPI003F4E9A88